MAAVIRAVYAWDPGLQSGSETLLLGVPMILGYVLVGLFTVSSPATAGELNDQYRQSQTDFENQQAAAVEAKKARGMMVATDKARARIAAKMSPALASHRILISAQDLFDSKGGEGVDVGYTADFPNGQDGSVKLVVVYRQGSELCRIEGESQGILRKDLPTRAMSFFKKYVWISSPECISAPSKQ